MEILVVLSRVPYPLDKGDKLRAYHQLRILSKHNSISLFCLNEGKIHPDAKSELKKLCSRLEVVQFSKLQLAYNLIKSVFNKLPFQVNYFNSRQAQKKFTNFLEEKVPDIIYCQLVRTAEYTKKYTTIPTVIDFMDSLSSAINRRINNSSPIIKPFVKEEAKRLAIYENELGKEFDAQTIISKQDHALLPLTQKHQLHIVPNGVDTEFFNPTQTKKDFDLVFVGNMAYPPNVDAVCYFVESIFPKILKERPHTNFLISGTNPTKSVLKLASKNITITGFVEDIRTSYNRSKVFIAPLRLGAGLQNKLLEAMAMKLPFVASPVAFNALEMKENKLRCANAAEGFAQNCLKLLNDEDLRNSEGEELRIFVEKKFSWNNHAAQLNKLFEQLTSNYRYTQ